MHCETIGNARLYLADCLEVLPTLQGVDALVTDPPYNSGGMVRGDRTQTTKAKYVMTSSGSQEALGDFTGDNRDQRSFAYWAALWGGAALRASKPGAVACLFSDWRQLPVTTDYLQAAGWVWRGIVPWSKRYARPQLGRFLAQCEYVVWGSNGVLPTERGVGCLPGFFEFQTPQQREHITQKPVDLMHEILQIVPTGSLVLDPFMGSGTTGVACILAGHHFVGVELVREHFDIACRRIEQAHAQRALFSPAELQVMEQLTIAMPEQVEQLEQEGPDHVPA